MYFGADKIVYRSIRKFEVHPDELKDADKRMEEIHVDAVAEYRRKAAEAAAAAEAAKREEFAGQNEEEAKKAAAAKAAKESQPMSARKRQHLQDKQK